jgi:Putative Ig domain
MPASTVVAAGNYSFQPVAKDEVKSRIKFDITNKPVWASFDGTTGHLFGTPKSRQVGTYSNISIRLTDWYGYVTTKAFSITVINRAPVQCAQVGDVQHRLGHLVRYPRYCRCGHLRQHPDLRQ